MLGDFRQAAALSGPLFPHLVQRAVQIRIPQPRGRTQCPQLADKGGEAERGKGASWGDMALSQDLPGCRQSSPLHSALGIPADRGFSKERGACFPIVQKRSQRPGPTPFTSSSQTADTRVTRQGERGQVSWGKPEAFPQPAVHVDLQSPRRLEGSRTFLNLGVLGPTDTSSIRTTSSNSSHLLTPAHTSLHLFTSVHTSSHKLTLAHTSSTGSHQLLQLTPAPPGPSAQIAPPAHTAYICSHQLTPALPAHASSTRTTNTTSSTSSTSSYQLTPAHTS